VGTNCLIRMVKARPQCAAVMVRNQTTLPSIYRRWLAFLVGTNCLIRRVKVRIKLTMAYAHNGIALGDITNIPSEQSNINGLFNVAVPIDSSFLAENTPLQTDADVAAGVGSTQEQARALQLVEAVTYLEAINKQHLQLLYERTFELHTSLAHLEQAKQVISEQHEQILNLRLTLQAGYITVIDELTLNNTSLNQKLDAYRAMHTKSTALLERLQAQLNKKAPAPKRQHTFSILHIRKLNLVRGVGTDHLRALKAQNFFRRVNIRSPITNRVITISNRHTNAGLDVLPIYYSKTPIMCAF
jgi:hypothetical protein